MKKLKLNLLVSEFTHNSDTRVASPLYAPNAVRVDVNPETMASQLYDAIHSQVLKKGQYQKLLKYAVPTALKQGKVEVEIEKHKYGIYPKIKLNFDYFYTEKSEEELIGFVPVLAVEAMGKNLEDLEKNIIDSIRLEFIRKKRMADVRTLLITQWYNNVKIHNLSLDFDFYTLSELETIQQKQKESILPEIAQRVSVAHKELYGLENEFDQLLNAMKAKHRQSTLVVAGSGKGKTALIREFVRVKNKHGLATVNVWQISAAQLLHRLTALGSWEDYIAVLCNELRKTKDILYVNNLAELFEVGQYVGNSISMAEYLRDYIARGEITILTECTPEEASNIELKAQGYLSLFSTIKIEELTNTQIEYIVSEKVNLLAKQKRTVVQEDAIREILRLQQWYTPYSELPGKTIHFLYSLMADKREDESKVINKESIMKRFCQETGMPEFMINPNLPLDVKAMKAFFQKNIYGQNEAIKTVSDMLLSVKAAVIRRGKPLATFLFVGPTGVGKTEMAKVLAQFMFGNRDRMLRFDMSEYADLSGVMRLTGDSWTGNGILTSAVRQEPFSVVLFDELEKVHPSFYDLLLQILGEGRLTDARGRVADFSSTIIIMTSNIGAKSFQTGNIGFVESQSQEEDAVEHFNTEVKTHFRPELFNRLDRVIAFVPLQRKIVRQILDREMTLIQNRTGIKGRNINLNVPKNVLDFLSEEGYDANYGARFLQRAVQEKLILPLSNKLNQYDHQLTLNIDVKLADKTLEFEIEVLHKEQITDKRIDDNMTLIEFINIVTTSRRKVIRLENQSYYTRFLSRIDQLERKLKKLKRVKKERDFWKNEKQRKEYYELKELKEKFEVSFEDIQQIEVENFLLLTEKNEGFGKNLKSYKKWDKKFLKLKAKLVAFENPEFNTAVLGIYAKEDLLYKISKIYYHWAEKFELTLKMNKIYVNANTQKYERNLEPEVLNSSQYTLIGFEFAVEGFLAYLYLKNEGGIHAWIDDNNESTVFVVSSASGKIKDYHAPQGVHRKNFFKNRKPRRTYRPKFLVDTQYNLSQNTKKHKETITKWLEWDLEKNIDNYLWG